MRYATWLIRPDGTPSPAGPSYVTASGIVHAQRKATEILQDLQASGALVGWSISTVTEAP
jgi:hypothetical protein